ncbi:MAG: SRPBCC domain-containing protein [Vicinamibacterales bacterium]
MADPTTGPTAAPTEAVRLTRVLHASPQLVFDAWTTPEMMAEWFARDPHTPPGRIVRADARPGGRYLVEVTGPENGQIYRMQGTYREVRPPTRLAFTWWYEGADFAESLVTIDLRALDDGRTEMTLTHSLLPPRQAAEHREGWLGCFEMLERTLAGRS